MPKPHETLGTNIIPIAYSLALEPDLSTFKYSCNETVEVNVKRKTKSIVLNADELEIKECSVVSKGKEQKAKVSRIAGKQRVELSLARPVAGKAAIRVSFTGINNDKLYGFYRSKYSAQGKEGYILTSQFEAANARNAFACFDEPGYKATFEVSVLADKDLECVSNMPVKRTEIRQGKKLVTFERTPKMSSYLLYIGMGRYDVSETHLGNLKIRMLTTPGNGKYAKLPLEYCRKLVKFYNEYFGIKYPLPKLDLIGVPDFAAGAMENWGAITFRESDLLADKDSSIGVKQRVAEVVAHELAHQWFGDLVTMQWWDDLWLNESFATFMSYKAMDSVFPEWKMGVDYITDVVATAFVADQLRSTHPISVYVSSPDQIDQIFDEISYEKGGTILGMIEDYAGNETFRKGLNLYLNRHKYSNARKEDLWGAIDLAARRNRIDVKGVAKAWIEKPGYPSLTLSRNSDGISISQQRFVISGEKINGGTWPIPITYICQTKLNGTKLLMKESRYMLDTGAEWLKLNYGQKGLYRVFYPDELIEKLGALLSARKLSAVDSWGVENDFFSRIRAGHDMIDKYLHFVDKYAFEADYPLNSNVLGHLSWIANMLYETKSYEKVTTAMVDYSNDILNRLGWEIRKNESTTETKLRSSAISVSGTAGYEETVDKACRMFADHMKGKISINPNLRGAIYRIAAINGSDRTYEAIKQRYVSESVPEEKMRLLQTLGTFRDVKILNKAFAFSNSEGVRLQDSFMIPAIASGNPAGRKIIWQWTKANWKTLMKRLPSGTHLLPRYVANMSSLSDLKARAEISSFFSRKSNMRGDLKQQLSKTLEVIAVNAKFMAKNL